MNEEEQEHGACSHSARRVGPRWRLCVHGVALVLVVAGLALAFLSGERLERKIPLEGSSPCLFLSEALGGYLRQSGVEPGVVEGGVRLYENASIEFDVRAPETAVTPVFLVARGTGALGVYPHISLRVDQRPVPGMFAASDAWGLYRVLVTLSAGRHRFELAYDNDQFHHPADRNLDLRSVSLGKPPPDAADYHRWRVPCRIAPERLSSRVYAEGEEQGVSIRNHGMLGDDICFEKAGWYSLQILMGQPRQRASAACLRVGLEGSSITNLVLRSAAATVYVVPVKAEAGLARLTLVNVSPFLRRPPEADICIEAISIGESASLSSPLP